MLGRPWILALAAAAVTNVYAQIQDSYPQDYTGIPPGDYSPAWQNYFQVTEPLPNISFPLNRNWAGNIGVQRAGHPNDTLFFWAFEKESGSLTAISDEPWGIWLNGGPGSSSMVGLMFENGPIHIQNDYSVVTNNYSWSTIADYVWVDQPVGVGFGTADTNGYVPDEDQMGEDFMGFLENLVKVFPTLATRPLHLTGESYAGTYIPYITKAYFARSNPPVKLAKIAIGDGTVGSTEVFELLPVVQVLETYPQLIGYDPAVLIYFKEQEHLCGYDLNLTYPQNGHFPTLTFTQPQSPILAAEGPSRGSRNKLRTKQSILADISSRYAAKPARIRKRDRVAALNAWKRDLTGRANGTIDPWYGCDVYDELVDYAINYTFPWTLGQVTYDSWDPYDVPDALSPEAPMDASVFLNDNRTRAAIHAPTSKDWVESINYVFAGPGGNDPSVEPMAFLTELASNATAQNTSIVLYSGNDDTLVPHPGTQVVIQNTTFGGIQGFTRKPSTPWYDDSGNFAGIVHQERNWTYVLVKGAGHLVGYDSPTSALVFIRDFVFGTNETGLVTNSSGTVSVVGGENSTLAEDVLPGQAGIYYGSGTTQSTYFWPSATVAAWDSFIVTATATSSAKADGKISGAVRTSNISCLGILFIAIVLSLENLAL